jgi:sigma-B regulation protein RsbU (phosphoserine phosphatase)
MSQLRTGGPTEPAPAVAGRSRASILIVDDTPANLRLLSQMLAEQGYHARPVPDGPLALAAARADPPDLILLDIRMPEMDGYLVCEELKADARTRDIPVIFISALDATKDKVRAFQSGGVDYVTKPFQAAEVLARVDTHLSLRELQKELVDANERMAQELSLAGEVQASFLPLEPPTLAGWQVAATLQPARQASGDFYDFLSLPGGRLGIVMADVSDKGAGAALFMALSCTLIRTYAPQHSGQPERLLGAVNRRILSDTNACQFVTVFYGVLDPVTGSLVYGNAAHPPPLLFRMQDEDAGQMAATGIALGILEDRVWRRGSAQLDPGDLLVLYTDGITEARGEQDLLFGEERLLASVGAILQETGPGPPTAQEILDAILSDVRRFAGSAPQSDDIALIVLVREDARPDPLGEGCQNR